jgi:MoaA/NifB/PqqE/SkfB family radical SAM enzyme
MENLTGYLNNVVEVLVKQTIKSTLKNPLESAFFLRCMGAQQKAAKKRQAWETEGLHVPPFLIASITSQCNLYCKGCYARASSSCGEEKTIQLTDDEWTRVFREAYELGISFILLAGGEPLIRKNVLRSAAGFSDIIFPVFTNGTFIGDDYISLFHKHRNLIPVISLEGDKERTEERRGTGVFTLIKNAMSGMKEKGIYFGASITVTSENLELVTSDSYISSLYSMGCKLVFFVEYVPADGSADLALTEIERKRLECKVNELRDRFEYMVFVAFPGDEEEVGGCLAAGRGFFHINPQGGAEPCPFSPFSDTNIKTCSLKEALQSPLFRKLELGGLLQGEHTGGCTLFAREAEVKALL